MNKSRPKRSERVQYYESRQGLIKYILVLLLLAFSYRIFSIHQLSAGTISVQEKAAIQAQHLLKTQAWRGDILDRNGAILASTLILKKVNLDPTQVQPAFIPKLAKALMMPEKSLQQAIDKKLSKTAGRKNLVIKKNLKLTDPILDNLKALKQETLEICTVRTIKKQTSFLSSAFVLLKTDDRPTAKKICRQQKINGVRLQTDSLRYYPRSATFAPLLGRMAFNKQGTSGVEGEFDAILAGENGTARLTFNQDSSGPYFNPTVISPLKHGQNITLTVDEKIQFYTYMSIKKSVEKHQADSGSAIVLSPNGEILAMVNYPADDPNDRSIYNAKHYRNRVLADKFEPGSTMKPFTVLLALDEGKITAADNERIDVNKRIGHINPDNKYQQMNAKKILQKSHNLGIVNIVERLTKKTLYHTWQKLGFGQPLGLLPNIENSGTLKHFSAWSATDKRTLSFGYGPMEANLAQLARAYLVFANNGNMPPLTLIKNAKKTAETIPIFSKKSTAKIARLLDAVVSDDGSGYWAQIKGYKVAGKTGTAEMVVDGIYNKKGAKRTFFAGFVPAKNPKYIMAIQLDYPKKCSPAWASHLSSHCEGSNSAAITFKNAMTAILRDEKSIKLLSEK